MSAREILNKYRDYFASRTEPKVREWVGAMNWDMEERELEPRRFAAGKFLQEIPDQPNIAEQGLIDLIRQKSATLHWMQHYTADDFGPEFIDKYAHVELFGTTGHFVNDAFAGGVLLFGSNLLYPNHWHVAEEIYFPLTGGTLWGRDNTEPEIRESGEFIYHTSNMSHEMTMTETPLLALWMWHGGDLAQKGEY